MYKLDETIDGTRWTGVAVVTAMRDSLPVIQLREVRGVDIVTGRPVWLTPETETDLNFRAGQMFFAEFRKRAAEKDS